MQFRCKNLFDDFLAGRFITETERTRFDQQFISAVQGSGLAASFLEPAAAIAWVMQRWSNVSLVVSRSRFAEDKLQAAINGGVKQYVILGAGMDSFAFRCKHLEQLKVFEVDHPSTQAFKKCRLADIGLEIPKQLHFVPVDFKTENFGQALRSVLYNSQELSFFSLIGVTPYLTRDEIFNIFVTVKEISPSGSGIVFDYCDDDALIPEKAAKRVYTGIKQLQQTSSQMITTFNPDTLTTDLQHLGLHVEEHLSPSDIQSRYFSKRTDGYYAYEHAHFLYAVVD